MRRSRGWRRCRRWSRRGSRTWTRRSPIRSSSSAAGTRRRAASATCATSPGRTSRTRPPASACAAAGEGAAAHLERFVDAAGRARRHAPTAHGSWARSATRGSSASARSSPTTRAQLRERGQREFDRLDAEMRALAADATGQPGLRRGPARERRGPPTHRAGDARRLRRVDRAGARSSSSRPGLVTLPDGRDVRGRAVAGVPAAGAGRGVVHRAAGVQRLAGAATSSSRSRPTAPSEEEIQERLSNNSYGSIPTTSVHEAYPGHHWHLVHAQDRPVVAGAQGLRDAVLQRGLGAVRRAGHARAGLLHGPAPRAPAPERDDLPGRADHRRHVAPPGRDGRSTRRSRS